MRPRKLRHRPSDELIDIRESEDDMSDRGLPWLFSVFVVLFLLLTVLLFYFIFTTRDVYLSQKKEIEEDVKRKEAAAQIKEESEEDEATWRKEEEEMRRKKVKIQEEKVHVDIVPIVNRKTGEPDKNTVIVDLNATLTLDEETTTTTTTTSIPPTTTTEEPTTTTTTTSTTTTTTTTTTTEEPTTTTTSAEFFDSESEEEIELESEEDDDNIENVEVEEYEDTTTTTTTATTEAPTTITVIPETTTVLPNTNTVVPSHEKSHTQIKWDERPPRSRVEKFSKFAIVTHHEECSDIGKVIFTLGGNAIDSVIAAEFCISALHPHSTGPGFGAVMLVHSKKKNETFVLDGREKAPKNANRNTFVINPTIAHIGYSSIGVPGWISTLWNAFKQFGSDKITWKQLIEPTLELLEVKTMRIDRLLAHAFDARKNQILHERSFGLWLNDTTREGTVLKNSKYADFLNHLKNSVHAEHDFYGGQFAKSIVDEMKNRGGLISRQDLQEYSCTVTQAEKLKIGDQILTGPHLPYHFPILGKVFQNLTETYSSNPENVLEYYVDFVKLLQKANVMKTFVDDDLFEPEVKMKIDEWKTPDEFKPEEQVEQNQRKRAQVSFSRIMAVDEEGNAVNFMSTNNVPWGSVRRSPTMGFVWNNAMSSFDVFCRYDVNCVRGGKRPSVPNGFPSILLNSESSPEVLISPTQNPLETTAALVLQMTLMGLTPQTSLDHPRIYPQSFDQVFVETGVPQDLYRTLWTDLKAQFTHPASPVTVIHVNDKQRKEVICDFRQNTKNCWPSGGT